MTPKEFNVMVGMLENTLHAQAQEVVKQYNLKSLYVSSDHYICDSNSKSFTKCVDSDIEEHRKTIQEER